MNIITQRLSVKITVFVNSILTILIILGAFYIYGKNNKSFSDQLKSKGQTMSIIGAKSIGKIIEEAIDNGAFSKEDAFDTKYTPIPDTDPTQFHTRYDSYLDKAVKSIQDEFLQDKSIVYAVAVDANGYLPVHNSRYETKITSGKQKGITVNPLTKRIYNEQHIVTSNDKKEAGLLQKYKWDQTGNVVWDFSSPIYVKNKYWGSFTVGFASDASGDTKSIFIKSLMLFVILYIVLSSASVFFIVNRSLKPLVQFTQMASDLADGKVDEKIESTSKDEIGQLAEVLDRLRISLKAAMDRLMQK